MRRKSPTTVEELADRLDLEPDHVALLRLALTHRSQGDGAATDNERLEFLGDSILGMLANEYLYLQYPEASEGQLTRMKANLVSKTSLARPARTLGLGQMLDLARGEEAAGGRDRTSTLADTFEAVLAAIYLSVGLEGARRFVHETLIPEVDLTRAWDYKSTLQELLQERFRSSPVYRITSESGPAHAREFHADVYLKDQLLGAGRGGSKKQAEQVAAAEALAALAAAKKPRRSRKKTVAAPEAVPAPESAAAATAVALATHLAEQLTGEPPPPPVESPAPDEKPKRARRSRKAPPQPAAAAAEPPAVPALTRPEPEAAPEAPPKRARRTRKAAPAAGAEPSAVEVSAPELAAEPPSEVPPAPPRRRGGRARAVPEPGPPAEAVPSKAKRTRKAPVTIPPEPPALPEPEAVESAAKPRARRARATGARTAGGN